MEHLIIKQDVSFKQNYEKPKIDIIQISSVDIIATSGGNGNQGERNSQPSNEIW